MLQKEALGVEADTARSSGVQLKPHINELQQKIMECNNGVTST